MKIILLAFCSLFLSDLCAQTVTPAVQAAWKHKRFTDAFNAEYKNDSIWFYARIQESWAVNGMDTTHWILRTPTRLREHKFEQSFDTSSYVSEHTTVTDSTWSNFTQSKYRMETGQTFYGHAWIKKGKQRVKQAKDYVKLKTVKKPAAPAKYTPFAKLVGYFPNTSDITPDELMPTLPANIKSENVGYVVIRCDQKQLMKILALVK